MEVTTTASSWNEVRADVLAVLLEEGDPLAALADVDRALGGWIADAVRPADYMARRDRTLLLFTHGKAATGRMLLVGMGAPTEGHERADGVRRAAALAAREARTLRARRLAVWCPGIDPRDSAAAIVEGAHLGAYRYEAYKKSDEPRIEHLQILAPRNRQTQGALQRARVMAEATCFARDLVNGPPNEVTPTSLAQTARSIARQTGLRLTVYGPEQLRRMGAGGILAVGQGSRQPQQMIVLEYRPHRTQKTYALVGKGVTFDAGGLDIKTHEGMETMKSDMAGAAAVLAAMRALPTLDVRHRVYGVVGAVENMLGGAAFKPGDIVRAMNGKTIEINNTDAEGRVVLADCFSYVVRHNPDAIVDLATLTGAAMVALGHHAAAVIGNDRALVGDLIRAGQAAGERIWELPLYEEFAEAMRSDVADLKNSGGRYGGAQKGAAFLREFTGGRPWAHLDIAGPAFLDKSEGQAPHLPRGATGFGVRTLLRWLLSA
ncbi:MAG: leucyl aminopeptidase [Armatimonadota bacterium]|nr:leucyl aminopeptidase [Armatimonadota bacterium]MDR5696172.1 leucyl aminopeptidase [Armatimonadota bacterium]